MKNYKKPLIASVTGTLLFAGAVCDSQAQLIPGGPGISGTATLADSQGVNTGPEALTIGWSVTESLANIYTYTYTVYNPTGDVLLDPPLAGQPETVDNFLVQFNTLVSGAVVGGPSGGTTAFTIPGLGIDWLLLTPTVAPGANSGALSFDSDFAPMFGAATASDGNPPSPWSSNPHGSPVPVPNVPDSVSTMALLSGVMTAGSLIRRRIKA